MSQPHCLCLLDPRVQREVTCSESQPGAKRTRLEDPGIISPCTEPPSPETVPQRTPSAPPSLVTRGKSGLCPGPGRHQGSRSFQLPVASAGLHRAAFRRERSPHLGPEQCQQGRKALRKSFLLRNGPTGRAHQQQGCSFWKPTGVTSNLEGAGLCGLWSLSVLHHQLPCLLSALRPPSTQMVPIPH